jgi:hypothetical protein
VTDRAAGGARRRLPDRQVLRSAVSTVRPMAPAPLSYLDTDSYVMPPRRMKINPVSVLRAASTSRHDRHEKPAACGRKWRRF